MNISWHCSFKVFKLLSSGWLVCLLCVLVRRLNFQAWSAGAGVKRMVGNALFHSWLFRSCALLKRVTGANRSCHSLLYKKRDRGECCLKVKSDGSNLLFKKEWFTLFKNDSLQICSFHPAFPLFMPKTKEQIAAKLILNENLGMVFV